MMIAAAFIVGASAVSPSFEAYKVKFDKIYASPEAEAYANDCWEETAQERLHLSAAHPSVQFEENSFSDQCYVDFAAERMNFDSSSNGLCMGSGLKYYEGDADLSLSVDLRSKGHVNPVKDQGGCGSCWAFSAVAALESGYFKATGKLLSFAEQELVSCDPKNSGCNGGMPGEAFQYAISKGIAAEKDYPYKAKTLSCESGHARVGAFSNFWYLGNKQGKPDERMILAALQNEGVVSITVAANNAWHSYKSGIMGIDTCPNRAIGHAVAVVGYAAGNQPYYIVRNSWGTRWGEDGYMRMTYGHGTCGITQCLSAIPVGKKGETVV